jgi:hypothetical protein
METTITDAQKMQTILDELSISPYRLTKELSLSSSAIYHVLSGKNQLSINIIDKICTLYPEVNKKYLIKGVGEPLVDNTPGTSLDAEYILVKKQDFEKIKEDIKNIYELLQKKNKK